LEASPLWELGAITAPTKDQSYHAIFGDLARDVAHLGMEAQPTGARAGIGYADSPRRVFMLSGRHDSARGRTFDVVVVDEAQTKGLDSGTWAALEPTTRTRPNGLLIATGTAGVEGAELFRRLYDRAQLAVARPADDPRYGALVWEGVSPEHTDAAILEANPGVRDGLLELEVLRSTRRSLTPARFAAETLNRWVTDPTHAWAPPGAWDACSDPLSVAPAEATPYFGVDVTPAWSRGSIAVAVLDGERVHVELARDFATVDVARVGELVMECRQLLRRYPRSRLGFDSSSPIAAALRDLSAEMPGRIEELGAGPFRAACAGLLGHVVSRTLRHRSEPELDSAARLAARSEDSDQWRFVRRHSAGHIDALVAATVAVHLADRPAPPRPSIR
jgi:hypothetical protein